MASERAAAIPTALAPSRPCPLPRGGFWPAFSEELGIIFSVPPPPTPAGPPADAACPEETTPSSTDDVAPEPQFILQEHKLGVSVHSIHPLINEARAAFPVARREYRRLRRAHSSLERMPSEESSKPKEGRGGALSGVAVAAATLLSVTRALLLVNADHGSAWNTRKQLVVDGLCEGSSIPQEIKLLNLIFTKHAKSPNAWAHRRWCWRNNERFRARHADITWHPLDEQEELKVCQRVAELYPKNYYAWTQRSWVVLRAVGGARADASAGQEGLPGEDTPTAPAAAELLEREIEFVDRWLTSHVSDHSALNHRKNVFSALAAMSPASDEMARLGLVDKERSANSKLLRDYPGHESLWCYRRFVCQARLVTAPSSVAGPAAAAGRQSEEPPPSSSDKDRRGSYDWEAWGRAVTEWHDGCVREDDRAAAAEDSDEDSEEEHEHTTATEETDFEEAEGALPGAPSGGGPLATFLGQEARFALKCATDKGAWQFDRQRRHALAYLAFLSHATDRIVLGSHHHHQEQPRRSSSRERRSQNGNNNTQRPAGATGFAGSCKDVAGHVGEAESTAGGGCLTYCEVTGAPKLKFPLALLPSPEASAHAGGPAGHDSRGSVGGGAAGRGGGGGGGCPSSGVVVVEESAAVRALRALNLFVAALAKADADDHAVGKNRCGGGGIAPYTIHV
ncbi:conserved unknown protein [Ectocarpus siliculosus]|uniref:Uncharacterized protein n=1 Tax=Ectocarpus siliculosus TaxID=2880 RepID=D7G9E1_ECTSI|nr:conserved unknown protein [Ectocarpus siliculosus]|eukprot:CBJ28281.1 conserved unknown protein [Ectocarpus siliculosus]